jgi:hypothetical protein
MKQVAVFLVLMAVLLTIGVAMAQTSGEYDLSWSTIDGGGGNSSGGNYMLSGTIGQPDAGTAMSGDDYRLIGGFWAAGTPARGQGGNFDVYLPLTLRQ